MLSFQAAASPLFAGLRLSSNFSVLEADVTKFRCYLTLDLTTEYYIQSLWLKSEVYYAICSVNRHATYDLIPIYETADLSQLSLWHTPQCRCKASYRYIVTRTLISCLVNTLRKESRKTLPTPQRGS
jgi:hypothetical protein